MVVRRLSDLLDLFMVRSGSIILTVFSGPLCLGFAIHTHLLCLHFRPKTCGRIASEAVYLVVVISVREVAKCIRCFSLQYSNGARRLATTYYITRLPKATIDIDEWGYLTNHFPSPVPRW